MPIIFNPLSGSFDFTGAAGSPGGVTPPGGSSTHIQFNSGGYFAGSADLAWDDTNKNLSLGLIAGGGTIFLGGENTNIGGDGVNLELQAIGGVIRANGVTVATLDDIPADTSVIPDSIDRRYVTDLQLADIATIPDKIPFTGATGDIDMTGATLAVDTLYSHGGAIFAYNGGAFAFYEDAGITATGNIFNSAIGKYNFSNPTTGMSAILDVTGLSADRSVIFPDKDGTIAMLDDIVAGGGVTSVNGEVGVVVLDALDVGADEAGAAASAVTAHETAFNHSAFLLNISGEDLSTADNSVSQFITAADVHTHANMTALNAVVGVNTGDQDLSGYLTSATAASTYEPLRGADDNYVTDAEKAALHTHANKATLDLITAAFTTAQETKLAGIATGAEVNVQADWNQATNTADDYIKNKPTLGTLAAKNSVDYSTTEVINKPTLGTAAATNSTDYATAAQGTLATNAMPKAGGAFTGDITMNLGKSVALQNAAGNSTIFIYNNGATGVSVAEVGGALSVLGDFTIADAKNIVLNTTTGTKFGTATTQKLAFYGSTPIVKPSAYTQTYSTASKTVPNPTAATLTDSSGGTANTTLEAIGTTYSQTAVRNNFADLAAMVNKNTADALALFKVVTALIDDLQALGLVA